MIVFKRVFATVVLSSLAVFSIVSTSQALADGGSDCHFHGNKAASEDTVLTCASKRKEKLISKAQIDASWKDIKHEKIEQVDGKKGKEWLVTFKDPAAKEKMKETLYMFFTPIGNFIAANFTGK